VIVLAGACGQPTPVDEVPYATTGAAQTAVAIAESPATRQRVAELRQRFMVAAVEMPRAHLGASARESRPVIREGVATGFEREGERVRPVIPAEARRGVTRTARVELPAFANGAVRLEDDTSHIAITFALAGAAEAPIAVTAGIARYAGALGGADVVHRVHAEGTEDFVVFEERPAREELRYVVDVSRMAGLRLVGNTVEFLDEGGSPRLRVAPPSVVDADGEEHGATLAIEGCAFDACPAAPWGRAVTRPAAGTCVVRVAWRGVRYPAVVDPAWTATGSMGTARGSHTATLLGTGKVLVAGGLGTFGFLSSAELYDPSGTGTFAATGSMGKARLAHTATLLSTGQVLVAGGGNGNVLSSAELYDPSGTGTFAATGSMGTARGYHTATLLGTGEVLVAGGLGTIGWLSSAELYDPSGTGTFGPTGSMGTARSDHTATLLGTGQVLVAGGQNGSGFLSSAELYDSSGTGTFAATGSMGKARGYHTATLLGTGQVLVAGGQNSLSNAELYDSSGTGTFAATGSMATGRGAHTATLLGTGEVLVAGGLGTIGWLSSAELYDSSGTGTFAATGSMGTARVYHTATLLGTGQVLVAGGGDGSYLSSAELFDFVGTGAACAAPADCVSGFCNDGICCAGACDGACQTCTFGSGLCVAVTNADDPDTCTGTTTCDATGVCKLKDGQESPNSAMCASGFLSDNVCCDAACSGACDVCTNSLGAPADGTCAPAPKGYAGDPACDNGLACNGTSTMCPASCISDLDCVAASYCAADGTCQPQNPQAASCNGDCMSPPCRECATGSCVDGVCCAVSACTAADECHDPGTCQLGTGVCSNSVAKPDGTTCSKGTCQAGVCSGGKTQEATVDLSCRFAVPGTESPARAAWLGGIALLALWRLRRRTSWLHRCLLAASLLSTAPRR
jgi:hypothetical protein